MRCLVTGASGHIGSHLTRLLVDRGHEVTAMVRCAGDLWRLDNVPGRIQVLRADLENIDCAAEAIKCAAPQVVFHLAWAGVTGAARDVPANAVASVGGSLQLFRLAQEAGCDCWVGLGSQAEYGRSAETLRENLVPAPDTLYGAAKLSVSNLTEALCRETGIRYVWLRLAAAYGPMDDPRHLIPVLIAKLLAGERPLLTSGIQEWDYLYIDDAVEAIYRAGMMPDVQGKFVFGSGMSHPVRFIAERVRDMIDPSLALGFGEIPSDPSGQLSLRVDISAFSRATGWAPRIDLEMGLRRTIDWYRSDWQRSRKTTL
jgi:nucleoside-diphosphate-sugar epimerase